jgi:hypothetical protein
VIFHHWPRSAYVSLALAAAALLFAFDPAVTWWFPSCPLRALTGWLCPFCGSLRALHAIVHGAPLVAFALNPLTTVGAATGVGALVHDAVRPARATTVDRLVAFCFSARGFSLFAVFAVVRNALEPFARVIH